MESESGRILFLAPHFGAKTHSLEKPDDRKCFRHFGTSATLLRLREAPALGVRAMPNHLKNVAAVGRAKLRLWRNHKAKKTEHRRRHLERKPLSGNHHPASSKRFLNELHNTTSGLDLDESDEVSLQHLFQASVRRRWFAFDF